MKTKADKKRLLEILNTTPIIGIACQRVGISRQTFYRWRDIDPKFNNEVAMAMSMGNETINDLAESKLISGIQSGNLGATTYWLSRRHKKFMPNQYNQGQSMPEDKPKLSKEQKRLIKTAALEDIK